MPYGAEGVLSTLVAVASVRNVNVNFTYLDQMYVKVSAAIYYMQHGPHGIHVTSIRGEKS